MNEQRGEDILEELRKISRLLVLIATKDSLQQKDQIGLLARAGFKTKEIADLLGTTAGTVSVALVRLRKETKARNTP